MKSVKMQPTARCFDYMVHHISVLLTLVVGILGPRAFKINKFCFNLFLILYFKNVFRVKTFVCWNFSFKHMFLGRMFINRKQSLGRTYCVSYSKSIKETVGQYS